MQIRNPLPPALLATALLAAVVPESAAQTWDPDEWLEQCRDGEHRSRDSRYRACEVREITLPATGAPLSVDGRRNGGVAVRAWDRDEILIQALITASASTAERAGADAAAIRIRTDGHVVRAEGPDRGDREWWSVSYRVHVPRRTDLELRASNGGLAVEGVLGRIQLETTNGGIRLARVGGDVSGRTTNGGVSVELDGATWQGSGLDLRTTNGGVRLRMPEGYSARLETGTTNGRIETDLPITVTGRISRALSGQIGQGGPPIRVRTTNGHVRIQRS